MPAAARHTLLSAHAAGSAAARLGALGPLPTPGALLQTAYGQPLHMMREMLARLPFAGTAAAGVRFPQLAEQDRVMARVGRTASDYLCLQGRLAVFTLRDPARFPAPQANDRSLGVDTWGGRRRVTPCEYAASLLRMRPDVAVALCDEVGPTSGSNRTRAGVDRSARWLVEVADALLAATTAAVAAPAAATAAATPPAAPGSPPVAPPAAKAARTGDAGSVHDSHELPTHGGEALAPPPPPPVGGGGRGRGAHARAAASSAAAADATAAAAPAAAAVAAEYDGPRVSPHQLPRLLAFVPTMLQPAAARAKAVDEVVAAVAGINAKAAAVFAAAAAAADADAGAALAAATGAAGAPPAAAPAASGDGGGDGGRDAAPLVVGYLLGGLGLGESPEARLAAVADVTARLPPGGVRVAPGVGCPAEVLALLAVGVDIVDSDYTSLLTQHGYAACFRFDMPPAAAAGAGDADADGDDCAAAPPVEDEARTRASGGGAGAAAADPPPAPADGGNVGGGGSGGGGGGGGGSGGGVSGGGGGGYAYQHHRAGPDHDDPAARAHRYAQARLDAALAAASSQSGGKKAETYTVGGGAPGGLESSEPSLPAEDPPPTVTPRTAQPAASDALKLQLRDKRFARDAAPLVPGCACFACAGAPADAFAGFASGRPAGNEASARPAAPHGGHSRAYVHHLLNAHEMLGDVLLSVHNTAHYAAFLAAARAAVAAGPAAFAAYRRWFARANASLR